MGNLSLAINFGPKLFQKGHFYGLEKMAINQTEMADILTLASINPD